MTRLLDWLNGWHDVWRSETTVIETSGWVIATFVFVLMLALVVYVVARA